MNRENLITPFIYLLIYSMLLLAHGYLFGTGDMVQLNPLILFYENLSLFPEDLYIQNAVSSFPNERFFFLALLKAFPAQMEWISFLLHIVFSILLLSGIKALSASFIENNLLRWLVILILFIPLYGINLGSNELYYGIFHPSLVAKAVGIWAFVMWLRGRVIFGLILSSVSTLMHPVAGLQVFTLIFTGESISSLINKRSLLPKRLFIGSAIWFLTSGIFLIAMFFRFKDSPNEGLDFYQIFYIFRNPHHYIPDAFGTKNWIIFSLLIAISLLVYTKTEVKLVVLFSINIMFLAIYSIGVYYFQSETITTLQWFKSTIWIELFAVIAVVRLIEQLFSSLHLVKFVNITGGLLIAAILIYGLFVTPSYSYASKYQSYQLPFRDYTNDEIDISNQIKEKTPVDALFIHPCHFTELKYFGQRSSFVEYKALTHTKSFLLEWSKRLKTIYNLDYYYSPSGYYTCAYADEEFRKWDEEGLKSLNKEYGITHLLTFTDVQLNLPIVAQNKKYIVYDCQNLGH